MRVAFRHDHVLYRLHVDHLTPRAVFLLPSLDLIFLPYTMLSKMVTAAALPTASASAMVAPWVEIAAQVAPFASLVLFLAPLPTMKEIQSSKSVGSLPLLPYTSMAANAFIWSAYGILKKETKVWASNGIGVLMAAFYTLKFIRYAPKAAPTLPGSVRQHLQSVAAVMLTTTLLALSPIKARAKIIGSAGVAFCLMLFASPLAALKTVLASKSAASIPLPLSLATAVNCFLWMVTGMFQMKDPNIIVPNTIGLFFGLVQLGLKLVYGNGKKPYTVEQLPM